jgi:hypothetical protein
MFKQQKIGEEILVEMEKNIKKNAFEKRTKRLNKRAHAINLLNKAAIKFEESGMLKEAESIIKLMETASTEKPKVYKKAKKEEIKEEDSIIEINNEDEEKEEEDLYDSLMDDPNIAIKVNIDKDQNTNKDVPSLKDLLEMWT